MPILHISLFLKGGLLTSYDFRKKANFGNLEEIVFGKTPGCTSKLLQSFACLTLSEKRDKGLIPKSSSPYLCESVEFFVKMHFGALACPLFEIEVKILIFAI